MVAKQQGKKSKESLALLKKTEPFCDNYNLIEAYLKFKGILN